MLSLLQVIPNRRPTEKYVVAFRYANACFKRTFADRVATIEHGSQWIQSSLSDPGLNNRADFFGRCFGEYWTAGQPKSLARFRESINVVRRCRWSVCSRSTNGARPVSDTLKVSKVDFVEALLYPGKQPPSNIDTQLSGVSTAVHILNNHAISGHAATISNPKPTSAQAAVGVIFTSS